MLHLFLCTDITLWPLKTSTRGLGYAQVVPEPQLLSRPALGQACRRFNVRRWLLVLGTEGVDRSLACYRYSSKLVWS
jgi:hypothetical protein